MILYAALGLACGFLTGLMLGIISIWVLINDFGE